MKEVIIYENRKTPYIVFDVSTPEKEKEAFLQLFEVMEKWTNFGFEHKIEKKREKIEKLENPENELEDFVLVEHKDDYVKKISREQRNRKVKSLKREIEILESNKRIYEKAKEGDSGAAKKVCNIVKGRPYCNFERREVQNS